MAEEVKKSNRGRKPKVDKDIEVKKDVTDIELESKSDKEMITKLMEQMAILQKQVEESKKEKTDLQQLVDALKNNDVKSNKDNLPKKVKVVSLVPNMYNLTTEPNGKGRVYTFEGIGSMITMKTSDLEDILSIMSYREQAEKGYFYILNKEVVNDQDLIDVYKKICDKQMMENVCVLNDDSCVDIFCEMDENLQESVATKIAENINNGVYVDRNRLADIQRRTDIDIEKISNNLKK